MAVGRDGRNDSRTEYKWTRVECVPCQKGGITDGTYSPGLHDRPTRTGEVFYQHSRKILVVGILVLCLGCLGLQTVTTETDVESLFIQDERQALEQLRYVVSSRGKGSQTVRQLVLQKSRKPGKSVLSVDSLIQHLNLLHAATKVSVNLFGITWQLKDICRIVSFPNFDDDSAIDQILKSLEACVIITPLDCFWEGSKLLGPDYGVYFPYSNGVKWSNLNPEKIVQSFNQIGIHFPHEEEIHKLLKRAGITSAYQELPCLNPFDPECPITAPNYVNKQLPDVEKVLVNGCTGFASRFMVWDEDLIIGGMSKSASGRILRAEAIKSVVQLMGEEELYEFYRDTYKVHGLHWNESLSRQVLEAWQRMFTQKIQEMSSMLTANDSLADNIYSLSLLELEDCLEDASKVDLRRVTLVCIAVLIYLCLILVELSDGMPSRVALGCTGLMLIMLSTVSGFGICALLGLKSNVATEQVLPFLAIGLGASDVLMIVQNYAQLTKLNISDTELLSRCHRECCQVILTASVSVCFSFFFWTICPIPALQSFCFQGAVLIIVNMVSLLLIYPGFLSYDLFREKEKMSLDLRYCPTQGHDQCSGKKNVQSTETNCDNGKQLLSACFSKGESLVGNGKVVAVTQRSIAEHKFHDDLELHLQNGVDMSICRHAGNISSQQCLIGGKKKKFKEYISNQWTKFQCFKLSLFVRNVYGPLLQETVTKIVIMCIFFTSLGVGVFGMMHLNDGLSLSELVPHSSAVHGFLEIEFKHFGFSSFTAVTKDTFDYSSAEGQLLLHSYHEAFHHVGAIVKMPVGHCPGFWLQSFRSWLITVQNAFDIGLRSGCITEDGWLSNSSSDARLGHKLIIQTGDTINPFDRQRVFSGRLVDENGVIYPPGFYIYLSAWTSNSAIEYAFSEGNLRPTPRQWFHDKDDQNLEIPKSQLLRYTQLPFHLHNVKDTESAMATIQDIRNISDYFLMRGLPNVPTGLIFNFFEQYNSLHLFLGIAVIASLLVFFVLCLALMDAWTATVAVVAVAALTAQVLGFLGLFGIGLNAITAMVITTGIGVGAKFTIHLPVKFLMLLGSQNHRTMVALENSISSIFHGSVIAVIGSIGFASLEFDFITKYIFTVIVAFILFSVFDGLVVLPVLLSLIGPPAKTDAVSDNENQIPTLSLELHLNKTHSRKSSEQNAAKTNPLSVFATLKDSNKKLFFVNSVAKSTEISSDMTYEMSVFCNHGTPKESSSENIEYQALTANNTEFSYVNYSENPVRKKIATAKVEVYVHSQTKGEDDCPEFKSKRRKLTATSNSD